MGNKIVNQIICGNNVDVLKTLSKECVDLVITSPPYDTLRDYHGYSLNLEELITQLLRVMKVGGVIVWVVGDQHIKGSESGSSFRHALAFKEGGFLLHDTMIWHKPTTATVSHVRYRQAFEYMFVFSKGVPKTTNLIRDVPTKYFSTLGNHSYRQKDGSMKPTGKKVIWDNKWKIRDNVWKMNTVAQEKPCQKRPHPAMFPQRLVHDHIITWSVEGDVVLDPFCGGGTTLVVAHLLNRKWIGIDISPEYCSLSQKWLQEVMSYRDKKELGWL
jgi:site-specific DNA-methyltransferase (adenine-specific)